MASTLAAFTLLLAQSISSNPFNPCMISYNVRQEPNALAVGDIDGDGLDDVVVGGKVDHTISWYRSNGTAFIGQHKVISREVLKPTTVSVADLDGDGDLDVVAGTPLTSWSHDILTAYHRVYAFINKEGNGNSWDRVVLAEKGVSGVHSVRVADVDGDGVQDVVVGSQSSSTAIWLKGRVKNGGYGATGSATIVAGDEGIHLAQPWDIDGDGRVDVVTCSDTDAFRWFKNEHGDNAWTERVLDAGEGDDDPYKGGGSRFACHVDLDGDGHLDLVEANKYAVDGEGLRWYRNRGDATFDAKRFIGGKKKQFGVACADFDGDGDVDIVANHRDANEVALYDNLGGAASWNVSILVANEDNAIPLRYSLCTAPDMVQIGDFDGDGDEDVAVVCDNAPSAVLWLQNGRVESQACAFHYAPSDTAFSPAGDTEFPYNRVLIGVGIAWIVVASLVVAYALATFALGVYHFYEHAYPEERTWRNLGRYLHVAFNQRVFAPGHIADAAEARAEDAVARVLHRSLHGPARYHVLHLLITSVWLLAASAVAIASTSTAWLAVTYDTFTVERTLWTRRIEGDDEGEGDGSAVVWLARYATVSAAVACFAFAALLLASLAVPAKQRGLVVPRCEAAVGVLTLGLAAFLATATTKFFLNFRTTLYFFTTGYYLAWVAVVLTLVPGFGLAHIAWRDHRWLTSYEHVPKLAHEIEISSRITRLDSLRSRSSAGSESSPRADVELQPSVSLADALIGLESPRKDGAPPPPPAAAPSPAEAPSRFSGLMRRFFRARDSAGAPAPSPPPETA